MIARLKYFWRMRSEKFKAHLITISSIVLVIGVILTIGLVPEILVFAMPLVGLVALYAMVYHMVKGMRE